MDTSMITRDPVCGMEVSNAADDRILDHEGHQYHFCAIRCRDKFNANPESYKTATDPVCGMQVDRATSQAKNINDLLLHNNRTVKMKKCNMNEEVEIPSLTPVQPK